MSGTLFVVATPIGNLEDLTPRARQTLEAVDFIAAEDTRHTGRLLSHFGVKTRLLALHDHNERELVDSVIEALVQGQSVALVSDADAIDPESGTVTLMTLHAAKGLEYAAVAMVGLEENLLPHIRAVGNEMELEEERRLCFVGITRAKRHLQLSRAAVRTHRGLREPTMESRFLTELPGASIEYSDQSDAVGHFDGDDDLQVARLDGETPCGEFPVGCVVRHPKFGLGRVEAVMPQVMGSKARVEFPTVGTKTLILEYAKLERVG